MLPCWTVKLERSRSQIIPERTKLFVYARQAAGRGA